MYVYIYVYIYIYIYVNICAGDFHTGVFLNFCKIFKNIYLAEHLRTASSDKGSIKSNNTVRSLSKIFLFFCTKVLVFCASTKYLQQKNYEVMQVFV